MAKDSDILAQRFGYGPGGGGNGFSSPGDLVEALAQVQPHSNSGAASLLADRIRKATAYRMEHRDKSLTREQRKQGHREAAIWSNGIYLEDAHARIKAAIEEQVPFFDRLVAFWENHFTVSVLRRSVIPVSGLYVEMAIRPHVLGRFEDLLLAAELHPAMLLYLDLASSIGPNSRQGKARGKGLNENLAREILELHTLGVDGGYSQQDVTEFAKIMTGWNVDRKAGDAGFQGGRAEPGTKQLLGRTFGGGSSGENDYPSALRFIAGHEATSRFIAWKLVRHFISDQPPAGAVSKVARAFADSNGDLLKTYQALVELPEAIAPQLVKARTDYEFLVATLRTARVAAADITPGQRGNRLQANQLTVASLNRMQQKLWGASSPAGWPENAEEWLGPTALAERLSFVTRVVPFIKDETALGFLSRALGSLASQQTAKVVSFASSREEGIALVLASPEFNRR